MFHFCPWKFSSVLSGLMIREKGNNCFPFTFKIPLLIHTSLVGAFSCWRVGFFWLPYLLISSSCGFYFWSLPTVAFFLHLFSSTISILLSLGHGAEIAASLAPSVLYTLFRQSDILCCHFLNDFYSFNCLFVLICVARWSAHFVALQFISFFLNLYFEEHRLEGHFYR